MAEPSTNSTGQPLFIVDRDWLRQGSKARKSWTGNVRNRSLYGLAIQVTEYDVPEMGSKRIIKSRSSRRRDEASGSERQREHEQIVRDAPPVVQTRPSSHTLGVPKRQLARGTSQVDSTSALAADALWSQNQPPQPPVGSALPGFELIKGLECYLDYCE